MFNNALSVLIAAAETAGAEILDIYHSDFAVCRKEDESPLTLADRRSHELLSAGLKDHFSFPILSEEGTNIPYDERKRWEYYWLLDPLDGTKEFIGRNGEFTVNIALMHRDRPLLGVIYAPVSGLLYYAHRGEGAFKREHGTTTRLLISDRTDDLLIVGSRSHGSPEFSAYVERLRDRYGDVRIASRGSSLKFCLVAEGTADIYPRFGPTMEWDTAAGQIIVEEAGGQVVEAETFLPLRYNKQNLRNPFFIAAQQLSLKEVIPA